MTVTIGRPDTIQLGPAALAALGRLSSRQQIAMRLRYVTGMTTGETARVMGVRPDKVKTYVGRAKTQLRTWGVLDTASTVGGLASDSDDDAGGAR